MNPVNPAQNFEGGAPAKAIGLEDVTYTLFRHKRLVLCFLLLGIGATLAVRLLRPPPYVSRAKLMVHYVQDAQPLNPGDPEARHLRMIDANGQAVINAEIEIFTSLDVAAKAVELVGPEKILAAYGGGNSRRAAAGVVASGIEVEPTHTSILTISFKHPDKEVAAEVLDALIESYKQMHVEVRQRNKLLEDYYGRQRDESRKKLAEIEENLKQLKTKAKVLFFDETKHSYQAEISKAQQELLDAERELAEHKAVLGGATAEGLNSLTNAPESAPGERLAEYGELTRELDQFKKEEQTLLFTYKDQHPFVLGVRGQIERLTKRKGELEGLYPSLAHLALGGVHSNTNVFGGDVVGEMAEIRRLTARVNALGASLSNIQVQAAQVLDQEPRIQEVQRQRDEEEKRYEFALNSLEQTLRGETDAAGKANNISIVQSPSPPVPDYKKLLKLLAAVFAGCTGLGLALAFLIDFVLDRSIKRSADVERHLRLPVFLAIPDLAHAAQSQWWWPKRNGHKPVPARAGADTQSGAGEALEPWNPAHPLQSFTEGLRERLMTYFEIHNLNLKKPKLVAVTGCTPGSGVSSLASGLAASLSKTGEGNVLLVDMNGDEGAAHSFHRGKPGCGLAAALEPDSRAGALVQDNLYVTSLTQGSSDQLAVVLPKRFNLMVPKLKASDYDYIIFDMPPVSPTNATPRLASHMDLVLLVLEAEKTGQHSAARANALLRESRANVAAVLNKYRSHMPAQFSHEQ